MVGESPAATAQVVSLGKWSLEFIKYFWGTPVCPDHGEKSLGFQEGAGARVIPPWYDIIYRFQRKFTTEITVFREDSYVTCNECHRIWPVFSNTEQMAVLGLVNTRRTVIFLGYDDYVRDNRSSAVPMSASIEISRRWLQRLELKWEKTTSASYGANSQRKVEESLRRSLAMSEESEQLLKQTVDVTVPPLHRLTVRLHWKQIWQEGDLRVRFLDGTVAELPYRAAVELVFDQENIDG